MTLTDRDRKILLALIPIVAIVGYWFLALAPKRQEASKIKDQLTQAEQVRDAAKQKASQLSGAKRSFAADYATVIRLGKSIPASVDMPSLLVQLDRASRGTGIKFTDVKTGDRSGSSAPAPAPASTSGTPSGGSSGPTAPGSGSAQSAPGKAAQNASNAVSSANSTNSSNAAAAGSTPSGGTGATDPAAGAPGLETVPLDFEFRGSFFDLANFFHRMKRFVRVVNNHIVIRGRLMTINSFSFDSSENFPEIKAQVSATVYLAPKAQGVDAGATPAGPAAATPGGAPQTASSSSSSAPLPTPTATVTPR